MTFHVFAQTTLTGHCLLCIAGKINLTYPPSYLFVSRRLCLSLTCPIVVVTRAMHSFREAASQFQQFQLPPFPAVALMYFAHVRGRDCFRLFLLDPVVSPFGGRLHKCSPCHPVRDIFVRKGYMTSCYSFSLVLSYLV